MSDSLQMPRPASQAPHATHVPNGRPDGVGASRRIGTSRARVKNAHSQRTKQPSSCTECRRRKQKCNLGNPCINCARRFPPPICEYVVGRSRRSSAATKSHNDDDEDAVIGPYSHLDLDRLGDAILQVEEPVFGTYGETSLPMHVKTESGYHTLAFINHRRQHYLADEDFIAPQEHAVKIEEPGENSKPMRNLMVQILEDRISVAKNITEQGWTMDGSRVVRAARQCYRPPAPAGTVSGGACHLPMVPTQLSKELVRTHLQFLCRFKASLDGCPHPENRFMRRWVPFGIQDPLILHVVLYTASSYLHELGRLPSAAVLAYKNMVHNMLNEQLTAPKIQISDSAIMAVNQLSLSCWLWGGTDDLRVHSKGLKTMVTMRGGLQDIGLEGYISKMVIAQDATIALAHNTEPLMYCRPGFEYHDPVRVPFQVTHNSPLSFECPPFAIPTATLKLHRFTAQILDDVRYLFQHVIALPEGATQAQLANVAAMATQMLNKISALPEELPPDGNPPFSESMDFPGIKSRARREDTQSDSAASPTTSDSSSQDSHRGRVMNRIKTQQSKDALTMTLMYGCIRKVALVYCRAIMERKPTEQVLSEGDFMHIWRLTWKVKLYRWKSAAGIFLWIMVALAPCSHNTPTARLAKTMVAVTIMTISMENWHIGMDSVQTAFKLQRWLKGRSPLLIFDEETAYETTAVGTDVTAERRFVRRASMDNVSLKEADEETS